MIGGSPRPSWPASPRVVPHDCVCLEFMRLRGLTEAIASDEHFDRSGIRLP